MNSPDGIKGTAPTYVTIFLIICLTILFFMAVYWEIKDISRIDQRIPIEDIPPEEQKKEYIFYSTFNYENAVTWRMNYISAFVATLFIFFALSYTGYKVNPATALVIFFIIFFVYYYFDNFKSFHFWRTMASKVKPQIIL